MPPVVIAVCESRLREPKIVDLHASER